MGSEVILGVRLNSQTFTTVKLTDVNLKNKVEELRTETAQRVNLTKDSFDLIYCGCMLEDDSTLESCGIKSGTMIHVLKKKDPEPPASPRSITEENIVQLAAAFTFFEENPAFQSALHRFSKKPEIINNIILYFPELHEDPVAIAMLQAAELMVHFTDADTVRRIAKAHPVLVEVAQYIARMICEEAYNAAASGSNGSTSNLQPNRYPYGLDYLSDDEEMAGDSSQSSDTNQPPATSASTTSGATITTAQLAAALATARPHLQTNDLQRQLAQMHEIGLQDDAVNVQALQLMNGDVQAAIELVFRDFTDN